MKMTARQKRRQEYYKSMHRGDPLMGIALLLAVLSPFIATLWLGLSR